MTLRDRVAAETATAGDEFRLRATDVTRLEAFSDSVFAFALALLVVSTDVPATTAELFTTLREFPAFGLTFAVLVWLWHMHVVYFRRYGLDDAVTSALNALLLFVILFYVYPLKFMFTALYRGFTGAGWSITFGDGRMLMAVYSAGFVAVFLMFALLYGHALRLRDRLALDAAETLITRATRDAHLILAALGVVSLGLLTSRSWWTVPAAGYLYGMIGPLMWWHWRRAKKASAALRAIEARA
ncbi:MAG: DUF1211 domain-containing protein [Acidobacteria bacterium]|nr:DUF1211 domain-containing protein [Acidobacteriota bacterium]